MPQHGELGAPEPKHRGYSYPTTLLPLSITCLARSSLAPEGHGGYQPQIGDEVRPLQTRILLGVILSVFDRGDEWRG